MNDPTTLLIQNENEFRHFGVNGSHYIFDTVDMKLMKVTELPDQFKEAKFVPRDLVELPPTIIHDRAAYVGYNAIIELTDRCNLRCVYCYRQEHLGENTLSFENAKGIIKHIATIDSSKKIDGEIIRIIFFGGEPLLNFNVLQHIVVELERLVKNYQLHFSISTNGVLLTRPIIDFFEEHAIQVQVSFEGTEEAQGLSRPFANGKNSFDIVKQNLDLIGPHQKKYYSIAFSLSKLTKNIADRINEFECLGFKKFNIMFIVDDIIGTNCLTFDDLDFITGEINAIVDTYIEFIKQKKIVTIHPLFENLTYLHTRIPRGVCNSTVNVEAFGSDGSIYPCQRFLSIPEYRYGNAVTGINEVTLSRIRGNKCYFAEECSQCWMKAFCSGKCAFLQTIPKPSEKGIIGCIVQSIIWDAIIKGYILLKEKNPDLLDHFYTCKAND